MKHEVHLHESHALLSRLHTLPKKMVLLHGIDNMPEFVLHELCHSSCFNIPKAAYFVDNPDFDCLQGVAGISDAELSGEDIWRNPNDFSAKMKRSQFNQKVREFSHKSPRRQQMRNSELVSTLAHELGIKNPDMYQWDMKYDNHGLLLIEKTHAAWKDDYLLHSAYLFSFCPVH